MLMKGVSGGVGEGAFCFNDTATTEIYTLTLHDALPISALLEQDDGIAGPLLKAVGAAAADVRAKAEAAVRRLPSVSRSEEHTSELLSRYYLVCRLLCEKIITFFTSRSQIRLSHH